VKEDVLGDRNEHDVVTHEAGASIAQEVQALREEIALLREYVRALEAMFDPW